MGNLKLKIQMKYLALVALVAIVGAEPDGEGGGKMEIPDEAIGECAESSECGDGGYCVFVHDMDTDVWGTSFCGEEADCDAEGQMCEEFGPEYGGEESASDFSQPEPPLPLLLP